MDKVILVDKPAGMTSHDVVDAVRRAYKTRKVGHAGTLDPFATGLLIIGIGDATKRLRDLQGLPKTYEAVARLGATSSTGDPEGLITPYTPPNLPSTRGGNRLAVLPLSEGETCPPGRRVEEVLKKFVGNIQQTPPMYSAKKIRGEKLYNLARRGITVERLPVPVTIYQLQVTRYQLPVTSYLPAGKAGEFPNLSFRATVSSGTYLRTLAEDIGRALGCGAYLVGLKRTKIGEYKLEDAVEIN